MPTIVRHKITYRDERTGRKHSRQVLVGAHTDDVVAACYRAIVPTLGKPEQITLLSVDGNEVESPEIEVENNLQDDGVPVPTIEQINDAEHKDLTSLVQVFRAESRLHREYFNAIRLNMGVKKLRAVIIARLHPEGELPKTPDEVLAKLEEESND